MTATRTTESEGHAHADSHVRVVLQHDYKRILVDDRSRQVQRRQTIYVRADQHHGDELESTEPPLSWMLDAPPPHRPSSTASHGVSMRSAA
jgi:hypothetical protein